MINTMLNKINPSIETKNKITLWLNHLLVLYTFLIPIHNGAKSSMFFTMLVLFLYRRDYWFYLKEAFSNRIIQSLLIFYLVGVFGMLYTDNIDYGKDHMDRIKYLLFPLIFLSFLDIRFVLRIIIAFILGMLISEIFSYLVYYQVIPYSFSILKFEIWETTASYLSPFMAHSDHAIGISIVTGFLLYYLLNFKNETLFRKSLSLLFLLIALGNFSFIRSRTGYLTLLLVILVVIFLTYKKNIKLLLLSVLLFCLASFSLYSFSDTINKRVNKSITSVKNVINSKEYFENGSTSQRIGLSIYGMEIIKENIIFGVGTGDHMDLLRKQIPEEQKELRIIGKPHNVYIQILMQHGIIGFISFVFLIYTILAYKNTSRNKKDIMIIITCSALIFMGGGMLYGSFELPLFMVFISAMIVVKEQSIIFKKVDSKQLLKYFAFIVLFLIIGITR